MHPALYQQLKTCPACARKFNLTRTRNSACTVLKRDTDFHIQYSGLDPNLYCVWVCPHCGYAASETTFDQLDSLLRQPVRTALAERTVPPEAEGERTPAGAVVAYEQAIHLAPVRKLSPSNLAGLHLKLAWVYRGLGEEAKEREELAAARDLYRTAFDHERLGGTGKMSETTVAYLVGELCRRTGEYATAINWFSRLVSDPRTKLEPQILNLAREQWYVARRQAAGARDESGEEAAEVAPASEQEAVAPPPAEGSEPAPAASLPAEGGSRPAYAVPAARAREGKISSMVPLYRDQVEWLQKVVAAADGAGGRLALADVIRAGLDLVVLAVPPERLGVRTERELRERLISLFRQAEGE